MAKSLKWISLAVLGLLVVVAGCVGLTGKDRVLFLRYITISRVFSGVSGNFPLFLVGLRLGYERFGRK